jgi:hypothetical protein
MPVPRHLVPSTGHPCYQRQKKGGAFSLLSGTNEEANFRDLQAVLSQLGNVASHANVLFAALYEETKHTGERVALLSRRISSTLHGDGPTFVESRFVVDEEPLRFYERDAAWPTEQPTSEPADTNGENLFTKKSMPDGLRQRCQQTMEPALDFSAVDLLSVRQTTAGEWVDMEAPEFKAAALSISDPNSFSEQFIAGLMADANRKKELQRAKREKRKEGRARKKTIQSDKKARVRRVHKKKRGGLKDIIGVDEDDDAESVFKKLDVDSSGYLEHREIRDAFTQLGEQMNDDQLQEAIAKMDGDADGKVHIQLQHPS